MSIVYLSSDGQNPHNFTSRFAQGIQLGRGAEVSVMGYSGNLRNIQAQGEPAEMVIVEGINDAFTVYHGVLAEGTSLAQGYYAPFLVKLAAGIYTPKDLSLHIAETVNYYEYVDQYKGGWSCKWNGATQKFTIKCSALPAPINGAGSWVCYGGQPGGITPAAADDTIIPFTAVAGTSGIKRPAFLDLQTGLIGDTMEGINSVAAGSRGYEVNFTTTDTDYSKIQFSFGIVPEERASRCSRDRQLDDTGNEKWGSSRNGNLIWDGSKPINSDTDFAMSGSANYEWFGFFGLGMMIGLDGRVGIIETKVGVQTNTPKAPVNRSVEWTDVNIGAAGAKRMCMCPRYNATTEKPVMVFLVDTGGGYAIVKQVDIGGLDSDNNYYADSVKIHFGMVFDEEYISATSVNAYTVASVHTGEGVGMPTSPDEPITIGWRTLGANNSLDTTIHSLSGLTKLQEQANIGDYLGFKNAEDTENDPSAPGWVSPEAVSSNVELDSINQPLIITSQDLTAKGYIGGGSQGNGGEAAILGVVRTNGRDGDFGFSQDCADNWIHLNNSSPLMLNSLNITLRDESNREANTLDSGFSVWLKFRANATMGCPPKHDLVVGGF